MKLIFFDLDGVLTPIAHGIQLAEVAGKGEELKKVFSGTTSRKIGLEWMVRGGARIFEGVPESMLTEVGKKLSMVKGAQNTIQKLKDAGYYPIIITNGIEQVAEVFGQRLGIAECYGNTLEIKDGHATGQLDSSSLITLQSKGDVVRKIVTKRSTKGESVAVGNDENDWAMFREVGFSVLFTPSHNLKEKLKNCLNEAEKGFKQDFIEFCRSVNVIIEEPDLMLLLPFLIPEPTVLPKDIKIKKTTFV
jgi:HAD superfamily phosphoserine phosphatase-like hydrolase